MSIAFMEDSLFSSRKEHSPPLLSPLSSHLLILLVSLAEVSFLGAHSAAPHSTLYMYSDAAVSR